jgi:hypothetical protein
VWAAHGQATATADGEKQGSHVGRGPVRGWRVRRREWAQPKMIFSLVFFYFDFFQTGLSFFCFKSGLPSSKNLK